MNIDQTEKILFNPLFTSKLLLMALAGSNKIQLKIELMYYVLPLIYNESIKQLCDDLQLKLPNVFNEILNNENVISQFIGKEISTEIVQDVAKKEQITID